MKTDPPKRLFFQRPCYKQGQKEQCVRTKMAIENGIRIGSEVENIDTRLFIEWIVTEKTWK